MNARIAKVVTDANNDGLRLLLRVCTPLRINSTTAGLLHNDFAPAAAAELSLPTSPSSNGNGDNVLFMDDEQVKRIMEIASFFRNIRIGRTYHMLAIYVHDECMASVTTRANQGGASIADLLRDLSRMFLKTSYGVSQCFLLRLVNVLAKTCGRCVRPRQRD